MSEGHIAASRKILRREHNAVFKLLLDNAWLLEQRRESGSTPSYTIFAKPLMNRCSFATSFNASSFYSTRWWPYLTDMVNQMANVWHLQQDNTQLVATTKDDEADSARRSSRL